jgi:hypothetical protein
VRHGKKTAPVEIQQSLGRNDVCHGESGHYAPPP